MRIPKRQMQPFTHRWTGGHLTAGMVLIALNTGIFVAQQIVNYGEPGLVEHLFGLSADTVRMGHIWQFATCIFLHAGWLHVITNMAMLYFAGRELEALLGPRHFLAIYFLGGLTGSIAQWVLAPSLPGIPYSGASACVLATVIAFTTILPELEISGLLFYVIRLPMKAKYIAQVIVWFSIAAIVVIESLHFVKSPGAGRIFALLTGNPYLNAHYAHLGGCLLGWLYVKQLGYGNPLRIQRYFIEKRQREERRKHMSAGQFIHEEIDPILEKISREGIRSLTRAEKRTLEMGRDKISRDRG